MHFKTLNSVYIPSCSCSCFHKCCKKACDIFISNAMPPPPNDSWIQKQKWLQKVLSDYSNENEHLPLKFTKHRTLPLKVIKTNSLLVPRSFTATRKSGNIF